MNVPLPRLQHERAGQACRQLPRGARGTCPSGRCAPATARAWGARHRTERRGSRPGSLQQSHLHTHVRWPGEQIFYTRSLDRETSPVTAMAIGDPGAPARASSSASGAPAPGGAQLSPCAGVTRAPLGPPAPCSAREQLLPAPVPPLDSRLLSGLPFLGHLQERALGTPAQRREERVPTFPFFPGGSAGRARGLGARRADGYGTRRAAGPGSAPRARTPSASQRGGIRALL